MPNRIAKAVASYSQQAADQAGFDLDDPVDEYARMGGDPKLYEPGKKPYHPMVATRAGRVSSWPIDRIAMEREIDARVEELVLETTSAERKLELSAECRGIAIGLAMTLGCSIERVSIESLLRHRKRHAG